MLAVLLVGGEGKRLRPLTNFLPKPMVPFLNRPFLEHVFDHLKSHGITEVILSMGYRPDAIAAHFGDGQSHDMKLHYVVDGKPLGTAGAVKNASAFLKETFLVLNGDVLTDLDLTRLVASHQREGAAVSIALATVDDPTAYGLVEVDANSHIQSFREKPSWDQVTTAHLINAGTYVVEPRVLDLIPPDEFCMFEQRIFPHLLAEGSRIFGFQSSAYWIDIGTHGKYRQAHADVLNGRAVGALKMSAPQALGWGTEIAETAHLEGPLVLGNRVRIGSDARLIGPVVLGDRVTIESGSTILGSVIWEQTRVAEGCTIRDSVLGRACRVDAGATLDKVVVGDRSRVSTKGSVASEPPADSGS